MANLSEQSTEIEIAEKLETLDDNTLSALYEALRVNGKVEPAGALYRKVETLVLFHPDGFPIHAVLSSLIRRLMRKRSTERREKSGKTPAPVKRVNGKASRPKKASQKNPGYRLNFAESHYRLRYIRTRQEYLIKEVAQEIGVSETYLSTLETHSLPGVLEAYYALAKYYETTMDYLAGAEWANSPERIGYSSRTVEGREGAELIDSYPQAVRSYMLEMLKDQAKILSHLVEQTTEALELRLLVAELQKHVSVDRMTISQAAVSERLSQLLAREISKAG